MADFTTHITTSTVLGCGYAAAGAYNGVSIEASLVAGGLCGISGMLPDIDSESGVPLREIMSFAAAVVPMLMLDRYMALGLNYEQLVMAAGTTYLFVRFGVTRLVSRYTVHRGMFHSIPALLTFTGLAFLICGSSDLNLRYFKSGGVFLGVFSHLLLDEIYAVEWKRGRWQFKKSFGTALKLWGGSLWGNFSAYAKLAAVVVMILSEPSIMEKYGSLSPIVVDNSQWRNHLNDQLGVPYPPLPDSSRTPRNYNQAPAPWAGPRPQFANSGASNRGLRDGGSYRTPPYPGPATESPTYGSEAPSGMEESRNGHATDHDRTIYDTARRIWRRLAE